MTGTGPATFRAASVRSGPGTRLLAAMREEIAAIHDGLDLDGRRCPVPTGRACPIRSGGTLLVGIAYFAEQVPRRFVVQPGWVYGAPDQPLIRKSIEGTA